MPEDGMISAAPHSCYPARRSRQFAPRHREAGRPLQHSPGRFVQDFTSTTPPRRRLPP